MSNLELKGSILELIASINDKDSLSELKKLISNFADDKIQGSDYWDELSDVEKNQLELAIEESKKESNHVSHVDVMKKYSKWLDK